MPGIHIVRHCCHLDFPVQDFLISSIPTESAAMDVAQKRLKDLQQEIRKVQRQKRKLLAAENKSKERRSFQRRVAAEICKMSNGSTTEAQQYLQMQGCMRDDGHEWSPENVWDLVASIAVEPCAHGASAAADPQSSLIESAAHTYLLNHNTCAWVRQQNEKKGIAPMMQTTWARYESLQNEVFNKSTGCSLPKGKRGKYKWAEKWAKTWGMKKGKLKCGSVLTPQQRQDKANSAPGIRFFCNRFRIWFKGGRAFSGQGNAGEKRDAFCDWEMAKPA